MSNVDNIERLTQNCVICLFTDMLGYHYLSNWQYCTDNKNIERDILEQLLKKHDFSMP